MPNPFLFKESSNFISYPTDFLIIFAYLSKSELNEPKFVMIYPQI